MKKKYSVVHFILNYNSKEFLKYSLTSLMRQSYKNLKIVVIDNDSTDNSVVYIRRHYPNIEIIENKKNLGVGGGFNVGVKKYIHTSVYMGFFNPDIILDKYWTSHIVKILKQDADVQTCCGLIKSWGGRTIENAGGTIVNVFLGIFGGFLGGISTRSISVKYKKEFPVFFATLTAMMVRSSAFKKYGLFDSHYFMSSEEADFCWRIWLNGKKVLCNPKAIIRHYIHGSKPNKKTALHIYKQTELNVLLTYYKNLEIVTFVLLFPIVLAARFLASLSYIFISPRITLAKITGLLEFFPKMFLKEYIEHRRFIEKIRKKSDWDVLKNNPTPPFSFYQFASLISSWFKNIRITFLQAAN